MANHDVPLPDDPAIIGFRPSGARTELWLATLDPRIRVGQIVVALTLRSSQTWPEQPPQVIRPSAFVLTADSALNLSLRIVCAVVRLREEEESR